MKHITSLLKAIGFKSKRKKGMRSGLFLLAYSAKNRGNWQKGKA